MFFLFLLVDDHACWNIRTLLLCVFSISVAALTAFTAYDGDVGALFIVF